MPRSVPRRLDATQVGRGPWQGRTHAHNRHMAVILPFSPKPLPADPPPSLPALRAACSGCQLRELCLPVGLEDQDLERLEGLVGGRRRVARGQTLFQAGERFRALYAVRSGFFKTVVASEGGRAQVTGFQMAGELLGLDGIGSDHHACDAIALEDSQVCEIAYADLERITHDLPPLAHQFHRILSREIVRDQGVMLLLGRMTAEERVAAFLLNLSQRLQARGYAAQALRLRMTREEIGSYLGLSLETVSRTFSKLQDEGLLQVQQRELKLLDLPALRQRVEPCG